jgi:hypothetical protein
MKVFHHTSLEAAKRIVETGTMTGLEDGLFFTNRAGGHASGYGAATVEMSIPDHLLQLDDEFQDGEEHYRLPVRANAIIDVRRWTPRISR